MAVWKKLWYSRAFLALANLSLQDTTRINVIIEVGVIEIKRRVQHVGLDEEIHVNVISYIKYRAGQDMVSPAQH